MDIKQELEKLDGYLSFQERLEEQISSTVESLAPRALEVANKIRYIAEHNGANKTKPFTTWFHDFRQGDKTEVRFDGLKINAGTWEWGGPDRMDREFDAKFSFDAKWLLDENQWQIDNTVEFERNLAEVRVKQQANAERAARRAQFETLKKEFGDSDGQN